MTYRCHVSFDKIYTEKGGSGEIENCNQASDKGKGGFGIWNT